MPKKQDSQGGNKLMKRFLAMLLAVVMVVSLLPVGVLAEGSGTPAPQAEGEKSKLHTTYTVQPSHDHSATAGVDAHICEHCVAKGLTGDAAKPAWTAWSGTTLPKTTGHYYITGNLSNMTKAQIDSGSEDIVICLNGKTLTVKDWNNFYQLGGSNKVTILDCTAHEENGNYVAGKLYGATQATVMMAYSKSTRAVFTMYDGIITNSTRKESSGIKNGGAIAMQGACTVNLYGGEISNCRANNGAAIFIQNTAATLNIDGAVIKDNTAITGASAIYGNTDTWTGAGNNTITIKNAVITGNETETAGDTCLGAIYVNNANQDDASLTFGGNCQITGNTDKDGKEYNLFLHNSAGKQMKFAVDGLSSDSKIGVRVAGDRLSAADGLTISKTLGADCSGNFQCNNSTHQVAYENNVLVLKQRDGHIHKACKGADKCSASACTHTDIAYEPWGDNQSEWTSLPASGSYYLTHDVTLSAQKAVDSGNLDICLNGFSINVAQGANIGHFEVKGANNLTLSNCKAKESSVTGGKVGSILTASDSTGTVGLYNVTLSGSTRSGDYGGAIRLQGKNKLEMVNAKLKNNTAYAGGAIYGASGSTVSIYGGEISGNTATSSHGGAFYFTGSKLTAENCKISNNTALSAAGGAHYSKGGAAIELTNCELKENKAASASVIRLDSGSLKLTDCVIEENQNTSTREFDYNYGAVYVPTASYNLTIQGATRIINNTNGNGGPSNLYLQNKANNQPVVTIGASGLSGNAMIGVTMETSRINNDRSFSGNLGNTYPVNYFTSDNSNYIVVRKAGKLYMEDASKAHEHSLCKADNCTCGNHEKMLFSPWGETAAEKKALPVSGCYYLTGDVTLESRATIDATSLNLCLNGHTVTIKDGVSTSHFLLKNGAKLNVTNCSDTKEGVLTGAKSCALQIYDTSAVELYYVVLENNRNEAADKNDGGGAVQLFNSATLKAVSCKFRNNTAAKAAGAVLLRGNGNQVTLINCEVKGNTASMASAIRVNGGSKLTLDNTVVEQNQNTSTSNYNYGAVFVENASCVLAVQGQTRIINNTNGNDAPANVYMQHKDGNQMVITVGEQGLSGNAKIGVTMESGRLKIADGRVVSAKLNGKDVAAFFCYDTKAYETLVKDDLVIVEENSDHRHCLCNTENCTEHEKLKFLEWNDPTSLPDSGNYCLMTDVVLSGGHYIRGDLNLCLNGKSIKLQDGVSNVPVFYMLKGDLSITDCKDTGTITGGVKNYGGMINVINGATFNLYGGTLTGSKVVDMDNDKGKGGAVYLSKAVDGKPGGVFNMYGGSISGNEAYRGGAVYMCDGSTMNMYGGNISGNTATYRGGAITNDGVVSLNIYGGNITDNTAASGAAIYLCNGATMTMSGGEITKNTTTGVGGAILMESADTKLVMTGGKIAENRTTSDGGAIYASRNTVLEISGGSIENNQAANGGGIYLNETTATVSGGSIKGNQAAEEGGGIAIKNAKVSLSGGEISGNIAKKLGGGVFAEGGTTTLSGDLVIENNQADGKNANLYLPGKDVFSVGTMGANAKVGISAERVYGAMSTKTDTDCSAAFTSDNSALKVIYKDKAVHLEPVEGHTHCLCSDRSTACKHEAVTFGPWTDATKLPREGNFYLTTDVELSAAAYAAADLNLCLNGHTISIKKGVEDRIINMKAGATLSIADCKDTGKITGGVHNYGGVINVNAGSTMNLYGGSLIGNKVVDMENDRGKAGAVYLSKAGDGQPGGVFNMYGGAISGNEAYRGGAVFACEGATFNMYGGTMANNTTTYRGTITNEGTATINIYGGVVTGNTAKNGAAIYVKDQTVLTIAGGEFTKNTSEGAGSVLLMESKGTKVFIKGGRIADNSTSSDGTIYVSRNTYFEMTGGSIENNKAKNGGGVYVNESTAKIGGTIKGNQVTGSGGGVYFLSPIDGEVTGGSITNNRCDSYGAGVYIYNNSTATISGGNISYNTSVKGAGGGVCMMGGSLNLKGGTIGYNQNLHKSNKGGGIMMYGGTLNMTGGYIVGNKVQDGVSGAGICCTTIGQTKNGVKTDRPSKITMYGGTIADHVGNYGGAVILQSKTVMNVYGGTFRNNEAKGDGGAVYLNGGSVFNMYDGTMVNNKAANRGGAICYFANTTGQITGGTIQDNHAGGYGGSIAAHGLNTKIAIKNMKFTGSESEGYGGAVSITWNAALDMDDCEIYENKALKGGAMYIAHKTTGYLDNVKIYKNYSEEAGGAFYLDVGNNINFTNVKIMDNESATGSGGGIYTRANLHLKDCLIDGNSAGKDGGGIATGAAFTYGHTFTNGYVGRGQGLIIENTKVTNNKAVGNGGGVCMNRQNWNTVINSEFTGNTCGEMGSGLFVADDLMIKGGMLVSGNTSKTEGYAVFFSENSYDGQSHSITLHEIGGNVIVKDNIGGEVMLCKDVSLGTTAEGYGKDTYFNITLSDGLLTSRVFGAYNYEGEDLNYTITYGTRSLDEPMEADITEDAGSSNVWLYAGVGVFAAAVIAVVVVLIVVKKKKAGTPAETPQE